MRPKVILAVLLVATGLLAGIFFASRHDHPVAAVTEPQSQTTNTASGGDAAAELAAVTRVARPPEPAPVPASAGVSAPAPAEDPVEHEKYVKQRTRELMALAMNSDVQSRDAILSEVRNDPDREIRAAALQAAIQFDDRSVVPSLQETAAQTTDPEEKQSILDAIDYINLPSLTEYQAANPDPATPKKVPARTSQTAPQAPAQTPPANQ